MLALLNEETGPSNSEGDQLPTVLFRTSHCDGLKEVGGDDGMIAREPEVTASRGKDRREDHSLALMILILVVTDREDGLSSGEPTQQDVTNAHTAEGKRFPSSSTGCVGRTPRTT